MRIEEKMRVSHVTRWQIVRTAREQTLAEHLYRVWLLVREFGPRVGLTPDEMRHAENFALLHDLPEVKTGDIATPVKSMLPPLDHIESAFSHEHLDAMAACNRKSLKLVKLCDLIEAVCFLAIEGMGQHAMEVEEEIYERIRKIIIDEDWLCIGTDVEDLIGGH